MQALGEVTRSRTDRCSPPVRPAHRRIAPDQTATIRDRLVVGEPPESEECEP